jgi:hypothetical protein
MSKADPQFDALTQVTETLDRFDLLMTEAVAMVPRMQRLAAKLRDEIDGLRAERERLTFYTEPEAAAKLGITEGLLADRRRRDSLPHVEYGQGSVRYSDQHLREIAEFYEIRGRRRVSSPHVRGPREGQPERGGQVSKGHAMSKAA